MPYLTRRELQTYMIQDGDNWILTEVHNRPHIALATNCDILKRRLDALAEKTGLSIAQPKLDGFPIFHGTYYIRSGETLADALSTLDEEIKLLEHMYAIYLSQIGSSRIGGPDVAESWGPILAERPLTIIPYSFNLYPDKYKIADFGGFLWLFHMLHPGRIFRAPTVITTWPIHTSSVDEILGLAFSGEYLSTVELAIPSTTNNIRLFTAHYNDDHDLYNYYIKMTPGRVDYNEGVAYFHSEQRQTGAANLANIDPSLPVTASEYIIDVQSNNTFFRYIHSIKKEDETVVHYLPTSSPGQASYVLDRGERLVDVSEVLTYVYSHSSNTPIGRMTGRLYIEGVSYISSIEIKKISFDTWGMILIDEQGDILFRTSTDGYDFVGSTIIREGSIYSNFEFPTFVQVQTDGLVAFFMWNYEHAYLSNIVCYISRDNGVSWEPLTNQIWLEGAFPQILKLRNGQVWLFYFTNNEVKAVRMYIAL